MIKGVVSCTLKGKLGRVSHLSDFGLRVQRTTLNMVSTTQTTNYASIVGIIVLILNHFHVNIGNDEIMTLIGGLLAVGGVISNWYHRYQKGDITVSGSYIQ